jgi:hypothetical protein
MKKSCARCNSCARRSRRVFAKRAGFGLASSFRWDANSLGGATRALCEVRQRVIESHNQGSRMSESGTKRTSVSRC